MEAICILTKFPSNRVPALCTFLLHLWNKEGFPFLFCVTIQVISFIHLSHSKVFCLFPKFCKIFGSYIFKRWADCFLFHNFFFLHLTSLFVSLNQAWSFLALWDFPATLMFMLKYLWFQLLVYLLNVLFISFSLHLSHLYPELHILIPSVVIPNCLLSWL